MSSLATYSSIPNVASSTFDVTISHPLQKKYFHFAMAETCVLAEDAKLQKTFTLCHWLGSRLEVLETVHETIGKWTQMESASQWVPCVLDSP